MACDVALHAGHQLLQLSQLGGAFRADVRDRGGDQPFDADQALADAVVQVEREVLALLLGCLDHRTLERDALVAGPQGGEPPVLQHHHFRQRGGELDQLVLGSRGLARRLVVLRQRAEHRARVVEERHRPAGPQPVVVDQAAVVRPKRRLPEIVDGHRLAQRGGRAAAANTRVDRHLAHGIDVGTWQARRGARHQHVADRVADQDRAPHRRRPGLDVASQRIESHRQRCVGAEQRQQAGLGAERCGAERDVEGGGARQAICRDPCRMGMQGHD